MSHKLIKSLTEIKAKESSENAQKTKTYKHKAKKRLVLFVKKWLSEYGGDYEKICSRMNTIMNFIEFAKATNIYVDFRTISRANEDFFDGNDNVKKLVADNYGKGIYTVEKTTYAWYAKKEYTTLKNYGVYVAQHEESGKPILYFGYRFNGAEFSYGDTYLYFTEDGVKFHNVYSADYDEHTIYGGGTNAEFTFDEQNRLVKVECVGKIMNGLFWGEGMTITFENNDFLNEYQKMLTNGSIKIDYKK